MPTNWTRRIFLGASAAMAAAGRAASTTGKPALLGGTPALVERPSWPIIGSNDERLWLDVLRSGVWHRRKGRFVSGFEQAWAQRVGVPHVLATNGGTTALWSALEALEVGPGDEVIVPPYTFIATVNVVLLQGALPIFVDTNRRTFQIDAQKIEAAITPKTRAIVPVHMGGAPADLDAILAIAGKRGIPVVEDACQAHLAEWRGRSVGSYGAVGCFSFQASKNLNSGEGGALTTSDPRLIERASAFHNNSQSMHGGENGRLGRGCNLRMTEFQGALLQAQMERLDSQSRRREENAAYLTSMLREIPGLAPAETYDGCTRNALHLYMFRYDKEPFAGLPRRRFLEALGAEGVPASAGYRPLNQDDFLERTFASRAFRRIYQKKELAEWRERNRCPENDRLCEEAVWLAQTQLLAPREDMEKIAEAAAKIQRHAAQLVES